MRSIEDKGCYNNGGSTPETSTSTVINNFEFHKGHVNGGHHHHHRTALGKPTPSKWDDAQKWLVGLSRVGGGGGEKNQKNKPRNSNADDRRLIAPVPQKEQDYSSSEDENEKQNGFPLSETKKVDCEDSMWRINKSVADNPTSGGIRSICLRDMGTEMTPIASQEPSRAATPIRSSTPAARSPISSGSSTPVRSQNGGGQGVVEATKGPERKDSEQARKLSPLEARALAWDEAERAKYMARYWK
ncbi:hypothetical protein HS088_TW10G00142 [Tripterygium wilfordii]|uniref:Remorin family protein n=1 Tax=Tripterygium wilfordii TaxID=458696 RepID=A0A7J7D474_TRIWF|nr:hypothetical protein HS088_TW10G00142 [Tripterygium wilfordii]